MESYDYIPFLIKDIYLIPEVDTEEKKATSTIENSTSEKEVPQEEATTNQEVKQKVNGIGHYKKRILVVIDQPLSDEDQILLFNIFKALKILLQDIKVTSQPINIKTVVNYAIEKPQAILHFDSSINVPKYELTKIDHIEVLYCHSLSAIESDEGLKRKLWKVLQVSILPEL